MKLMIQPLRKLAENVGMAAPAVDDVAGESGAAATAEKATTKYTFSRFVDELRSAFKPMPKFPKPVGGTKTERAQIYRTHPSFTAFLPTRDFDAEHGVFVFDDGINNGALFEITGIPTEARTPDELLDMADRAWSCIKDSLPEDPDSPWILQMYANNEESLHRVTSQFRDYVRKTSPESMSSRYTQDWIGTLGRHLRQVANPAGVFLDQAANGLPWRGKQMRLRIALYRIGRHESFAAAAQLTNDVAASFTAALRQTGAGVRRCTATDLYEWQLPWFSPRPASAAGDAYEFLESSPIVDSADPSTYIQEPMRLMKVPDEVGHGVSIGPTSEGMTAVRGADVVAGYDLGDAMVTGHVRSDAENHCWWFDGMPHRLLTLQEMTRPPQFAHLTGEREISNAKTTLLDILPEGSMFVLTIVLKPQYQVQEHLNGIERASQTQLAESQESLQQVNDARRAMASGNKLLPIEFGVYLRAPDLEQLKDRTNKIIAALRPQGLRMIETAHELFGVHKYVQQLPFAYRHDLDQQLTNRARLTYSSQVARLMPIYGRALGTGNPGLVFFNRGAEPILIDPIRDRRKNGHGLIFGPSGSGKSAWLNNFAMNMMAVHRPRLFILDPSASFGPLGQFFASKGLSVNYIQVGRPEITFNPYADALQLLETKAVAGNEEDIRVLDDDPFSALNSLNDDDDEEIRRDPLGEMELKTLTMITGGEFGEKERITRGSRAQIRKVILEATRNVAEENARTNKVRQVIVTDVMNAMMQRADQENDGRLRDMAHALSTFCGQESLAGRMFDTQGSPLPECDVTIVEFGLVAREGREAEMIVSTMAILDRIHYIVEKYQYQDRPTLVIHDEVHVPLKKPALAPYIVSIVKLWRKLGAWYWPATQDFEDVSETAKALVNNLEWLVALQMSDGDVAELGRFRQLTPEDRELLRAPIKQRDSETGIGDYAEGVVIRKPDIRLLFRSVMPPLALALAGTEKDEKALRRKIMAEQGFATMLEANYYLAERIEQHRATATQRKRRNWEQT